MKFKNTVTLCLLISGIHFSVHAESMTQSEAHMSIPTIRNEVEKWYSFKKTPYYKQLYDQVVTKERELNDSHYTFYNAFSNEWRVPQDLYLKLYERFHPLTVDVNDFRAFRWMPVDHKTPTALIKEEMENHGLVNDNEWRLKTYLLSTNLALFGNVNYPGECTFDYYLRAKSNTKVNEAIFKGILDVFDDPTKYTTDETPVLYQFLPQITALDQYLVGEKLPKDVEPQSLAQIFIPKSMVDKVAYLAWVQGIPYDAQLANWVATSVKKYEGSVPLYPPTKALLEEIRALFKDKQSTHPLFKTIYDGIEQGRYKISTFLEQYKNAPYLIPGLNNIQARLIISPEFIGSVGSDVKVFTYDRISDENKKKYEEELNKIVDAIFKARIERSQARYALEQSALQTTEATKGTGEASEDNKSKRSKGLKKAARQASKTDKQALSKAEKKAARRALKERSK